MINKTLNNFLLMNKFKVNKQSTINHSYPFLKTWLKTIRQRCEEKSHTPEQQTGEEWLMEYYDNQIDHTLSTNLIEVLACLREGEQPSNNKQEPLVLKIWFREQLQLLFNQYDFTCLSQTQQVALKQALLLQRELCCSGNGKNSDYKQNQLSLLWNEIKDLFFYFSSQLLNLLKLPDAQSLPLPYPFKDLVWKKLKQKLPIVIFEQSEMILGSVLKADSYA